MTEWEKLVSKMVDTEDPTAAVCIECKLIVYPVKEAECPLCGSGRIIQQYIVTKTPPLH